MRIEAFDRRCGALGLRSADALGVVDNLAVEIVETDAVRVDDPDFADTGSGEIKHERRAEPAGADDKNAGGFQLLLALAADLLQHQLPLVAFDLLECQHDLGHLLSSKWYWRVGIEPRSCGYAPRVLPLHHTSFIAWTSVTIKDGGCKARLCLKSAGRAETASPAHRGGKLFGRNDLGMGDRDNDELGNPLAAADHERLTAMIDKDHHEFAAVIGIYGAGAVEKRDPVLQGKA